MSVQSRALYEGFPTLGEQFRDRISFRRCVALSFTDSAPNETSFASFRGWLREAWLHDLFRDTVVEHRLEI